MAIAAFDFLGTLYTFDAVRHALVTQFPATTDLVFWLWLWSGLRDYFGTSHNGPYKPLITILKASLPRTLLVAGLKESEITSERLEAVMSTFGQLTPLQGALEALTRLKEAGWNCWVVTNGSMAATQKLLKDKGLDEIFREGTEMAWNIQACDDLEISKPHPRVYSEFMRACVHRYNKIENFYFVATHAWDLAAAHNAGMGTVFLTGEEKI
ncbi:hypothetical protein BZG36_05014 [Bifiguratus adelaidae]|uniref:Haloacid dehalogenase, type II n=1 Tax=Bifiguratus adelaidae TaxID=1938954 RepID=A0A261XU38_9FUNG|nr:hypothetical protein BZG36_05014 [Bifiguratus adelaidae]